MLAPGFSVYHSILGPVVIGVSYVFQTRGLREMTNAAGQSVPLDQMNGVGVFIAVDVPFFIFPTD